MHVISRRQLAKTKLEQLKNGYCAYAETDKVAKMIEDGLEELPFAVHIDRTPIGYWFIPETSKHKFHWSK